MIERGKFRSLTLINWNGFFARTFDLDQLVTTLSGGNGAGKSTTMAAFVTAMIPDLTLLHFRNTTEAGATSGSRDKGLHGKLRPGVCYSLLDVVNSRHQRILLGVRLQQIAGRDRKVDIKPFAITSLPVSYQPTQLVTELLAERQARIRSMAELKDYVEAIDGVQFKLFNSITDYHSFMFDLGVLPRRLRSAADRSKFYRLIEASLYGGISSAITRSLRDYLLPENSGVRKAFQDMESALRENRLTLEAIRVTQTDRDLFKHLVTEATHYVAADYMRHANERSHQIDQLLRLRRDWHMDRQQLSEKQQQHIIISGELSEQKAGEIDLETDYQSALDHLNLVQSAKRHQEKMLRYQEDLAELSDRLEGQQQQTLEEQALTQERQELVAQVEQEVDELKNQLADYQQALDVQQTRSLQYQQAQQALQRANQFAKTTVTVENAPKLLEETEKKLAQINEKLLAATQKLQIVQTANQQFEQAYQLLERIVGETPRKQAWTVAKSVLADSRQQRHFVQQLADWQYRASELEQRYQQQQALQKNYQQLQKLLPDIHEIGDLGQWHEQLEARLEEWQQQYHHQQSQEKNLQQELEQISGQISQFTKQAPNWLAAQEQLAKLRQQSEQSLENQQQLTSLLRRLLEKERQITIERDVINQQRVRLTDEVVKLSQPGGAEDGRLTALAERFSGVLLSEIYEDVSIDDASYFSALYGPSRHAIVVADLAKIQPKLEQLTDCPDDLYFIEGDPQSFDDSVFDTHELEGAILVKTASRQWRYSRFPQVPLFGRAAREKHLQAIQQQQQALDEQFANLSFDLQKTQRLSQHASEFVGQYLSLAFSDDPEVAIKTLQRRRVEIERELAQLSQHQQQYQQQVDSYKQQLALINRLLPQADLLADETLLDRLEEMQEQLTYAEQAQQFLRQHDKSLQHLETLLDALQTDPAEYQQLQQEQQIVAEQQLALQQSRFALAEVIQRRAHFSYDDAASMLTENADLNEKLRQRLAQAEQQRTQAKMHLQQQQNKAAEYQQLLASLKSAYSAKNEMLIELQQELAEFGVPADESALQRAQLKRDELYATLHTNRERCQQLEKQLVINEAQMDGLQKRVRQLQRDYQVLREQVVTAKASWCKVMRLIKDNGLQQRLHRRELAYIDADELRSISDKALGALRLAVADNQHLRDALRTSEGNKQGEGKILFFIAVYQHLRERIRQDIIRTDDPLDAIEQMEIELARLTEELTAREQKLSISAQSVASIIRKTIQREQNRIRQLNQGLQSVSFGQVKSVRLNVAIREAHASLLEALAEQHEQHQDLFESPRLTFSEALAKLYQRLNPQLDIGQRTAQTLGEELLDYRNYLTMEVEVYRGTDGWLRAESGALSTGEAIGTGMAILVMVVQSWEDESARLRGKEIAPCRLLFLDEAARLDAKSIATLFELCERLDMQLIIAAPENISPEKGTTYKLVRKVFQNQEHVHVVGLRGFVEEAKGELANENTSTASTLS